MKVYFITRFSICDLHDGRFELTRKYKNSYNDYFNHLYSENRLETKFKAFSRITVPAIFNQNCNDWEWHIYTSPELPKKYKIKLNNLINSHPQCQIFYVNSMSEFFRKSSNYHYGNSYATVRLDDDDGLNLSYVKLLQQYSNEKGKIISFPLGQTLTIEDDKILYGSKCVIKKIGLGLAAINMNIYKCGDHRKVDEKYDVIYNDTPQMYYLFCSSVCDTQRPFKLE